MYVGLYYKAKYKSEMFGKCRKSSSRVQGPGADGMLAAFNSSSVGRLRVCLRVLVRTYLVVPVVIVGFMRITCWLLCRVDSFLSAVSCQQCAYRLNWPRFLPATCNVWDAVAGQTAACTCLIAVLEAYALWDTHVWKALINVRFRWYGTWFRTVW
jgi:hypothetical protein